MAKDKSELLTDMFRERERKGDKRDTFKSPRYNETPARYAYDKDLVRAMQAERTRDVKRAKSKGLSDLTALSDRDYLNFQRAPGGYNEQTDDVRKYMLRTQLPRTSGIGGKAKGGKVVSKAKGGSITSASKRGDGCATKGKTKGRFV